MAKKKLFQTARKVQRVRRRDESPEGIGQDNLLPPPSNPETERAITATEAKHSLIEIFNHSNARATLLCMLNCRIPPQFRPRGVIKGGVEQLTAAEYRAMQSQIHSDFKWAIEQFVKLFPKELGVFGSLQMNHTLAGLIKRASVDNKSRGVIDLVQKRRERETLEYRSPTDSTEEEG